MMADHRITHVSEGEGESAATHSVCTCGWKGAAIHAWNDYQQALLKDLEDRHLRDAMAKEAEALRKQMKEGINA